MNIDKQNDVNNLNHLMDMSSHYALLANHHQQILTPQQQQQTTQIYTYYNTNQQTQQQQNTQQSNYPYVTTTPQTQNTQSITQNGLAHIDDHIGNLDSCINELSNVTSLIQQQQIENGGSSSTSANSQSLPSTPQAPLTPQHDTNSTPITTQTSAKKPAKKPLNYSNVSNNDSTTNNTPTNKRRKKDPLAPKAPLNGYLVYFNEERVNMRIKHPSMSFGELTKIIAIQWKELKPEEKQKYIDEAEADKERYVKEMETYKQSDAYKHYVKETAAAKQQKAANIQQQQQLQQQQQQQQQQQHEQHQFNHFNNNNNWPMHAQQHYDMNGGASSSMIASSIAGRYHHPNDPQQQQGNHIPIFTDDFMEHNKAREAEIRQLRKEINELELQNSVLTKHVDTMKQSEKKFEIDLQNYRVSNELLDKKLQIFRRTMLQCFSNLPLPNTNEYPNENNIDDYIYKLYTILNSNAVVQHQQQHQQLIHQQQQHQQTPQDAVDATTISFVNNMKNILSKFDFNSYIDC